MSEADKINLNWVTINADGDFAISVKTDGKNTEGICRDMEGIIHIAGSTPAGELVFGIRDNAAGFVALPNGTINESKVFKHGKNVTILCRATGVGGKTFNIAYAGNVS